MIESYDPPKRIPEMVVCLSCDNEFLSWNRVYNRICPKCRNRGGRPKYTDEDQYWDDLEDFSIELDPEYPEFFAD